jgi:hypothetical protein
MEARKIVKPAPPAPLPTFGGDADKNRYEVATPHFAVNYLAVTAAAAYAGKSVEIGVPTSLSERLIFADIAAADGTPDVGVCEGSVEFHLGGSPVLVLPFDFLPGALAGSKNIGFHVTSGGVTNAALNTLGVDIGSTTRVIVPSWALKINCSRIRIVLTRGSANAASDCYVILGCLSQGKES